MSERIAVYPGTFDPITFGHLDIIRRGTSLVDRLVIGVTTNPSKSPMFELDERLAMVRRETADLGNVEVVCFNSLLMDFAESQGASMILRGLRAVADFEYEFQMAGMNQQLNDDIETVFHVIARCNDDGQIACRCQVNGGFLERIENGITQTGTFMFRI